MRISTAAFVAALALAGALVGLTIKIGRRRGWVATPRADRWHKGAPSLFGGVPMCITYVGLGLVFVPLSNHFVWKVMGASTLMCLVGLADDVWCLRPRTKLILQLLAAAWVVSAGVVSPLSHDKGLNVVISTLWIVGITNAFNLLDNMDGLAAGVGLISAVYVGILYASNGAPEQALLAALLAGSAGGFLLFNFNPARIFMGDSGSLFLGFALGTASLIEVRHVEVAPVRALAPVLILALPVLDTLSVSVTRRLRGQAVSQGGTDHCSHRLVRLGVPERQAVLLLYALSAVSGAVALAGRHLPNVHALALSGFWGLFLLLFGIHIFRPATLGDTNVHPPGTAQHAGSVDVRAHLQS